PLAHMYKVSIDSAFTVATGDTFGSSEVVNQILTCVIGSGTDVVSVTILELVELIVSTGVAVSTAGNGSAGPICIKHPD
ncbi:MAG: hypothetical protein M1308_16860, partial [Actinobacteria bacterium]|nr:hypothetical protein [Actinomycetota bacterium]